MNFETYLPYIVQISGTVIAFAFILGRYKAAFDQHEKILDKHERILEKHEGILNQHEKAIEGIVMRLDSMNNDINFLKGVVYNK